MFDCDREMELVSTAIIFISMGYWILLHALEKERGRESDRRTHLFAKAIIVPIYLSIYHSIVKTTSFGQSAPISIRIFHAKPKAYCMA